MISTSGLQFFIPNPPSGISQNQAIFILKSEFYKAVEESNSSLESPDENQSRLNSKTMSLLLDYLLSVGAAVPIPKAIIQNPIKEKFNSLPLKNSLSYLGNISFTFPREVRFSKKNLKLELSLNILNEETTDIICCQHNNLPKS